VADSFKMLFLSKANDGFRGTGHACETLTGTYLVIAADPKSCSNSIVLRCASQNSLATREIQKRYQKTIRAIASVG
jgi:hypothetical protein